MNLLAGLCALLAIVFIVVPGPSILFLLGALLCLSINYPWARAWLKKGQICFKTACVQLDKRFRKTF
nr:PGPGW domain-containing protein [Pseudoalteromonas rubra]